MNVEKIEGTCCEQEKEKRNSQCKDPRAFDGNSQGADLSTPKANSQGKGPKGEKVKEKEKVKHRRSSLWNKATEKTVCFFAAMSKEGEKEKKGRKSVKRTRTKQVLGMSGRLFFSMFMAQHWLCVNAAAEGLQKGTETMERWQNQEVRVKESRWTEEISQRCRLRSTACFHWETTSRTCCVFSLSARQWILVPASVSGAEFHTFSA